MTAQTKTVLKGYFNLGDVPTEAQFGALVDTFLPSYRPEDYGAVANGVTDDTAALQAAVDAASAAGGGVVHLTGNYAYGVGGSAWCGMYGPVKYGIYVNANNIFIKGPGKMTLATFPALDPVTEMFAGVLFTRLGHLIAYPGLGGTWIENVGIEGVTFDNTALTYAQTHSLGGAAVLGQTAEILFSHARNFYCQHNTILQGYGFGCIYTGMGTSCGVIKNNYVYGAGYHSMWLDGLRETEVSGNWLLGRYGYYTDANFAQTHGGIIVVPNADNGTASEFLRIHHNVIINSEIGMAVCAADSIIDHNTVWNNDARVGDMQFNASFRAPTDYYTSSRMRIEDNTIWNEHGIGAGPAGLSIFGNTADAVVQDNLIVKGNRININQAPNWKGHVVGIALTEEVENSFIVDNFIYGTSVTQDGTCSGNVITPNY